MLSFAHTLISLPLAFYLDSWLLILISAFVLHLFCDTLLHWNIYPHPQRAYPVLLVALDIISGVSLAWLLLGQDFYSLPVLIAIAGGNLPDVLQGLWELQSRARRQTYPTWLRAFFTFHDKLQLETYNLPAGLISQILLIAVSLSLVWLQS